MRACLITTSVTTAVSIMTLHNFPPFNPSQFSTMLDEVRKLPENYHPTDAEFGKTLRGHAEINKLYRSACFDGRRGPSVKMHFNPHTASDAEAFNQLFCEFRNEQASFAQQHGIHPDGYATCILDHSLLTEGDESSYFLLVEVLDGNLHPSILGPGSVESFTQGPVAMMIGTTQKPGSEFACPIFTRLAFRELTHRLASTPLAQLQRSPTPSHAYALLCDAIKQHISSPSDSAYRDVYGDVTPLEELDVADMGRSQGINFLNMPRDFSFASEAVRHVEDESSYLDPRFKVVCNFDGRVETFVVKFQLNSRWGNINTFASSISNTY